MIRISTIFIAICMVLVAASLGLVLHCGGRLQRHRIRDRGAHRADLPDPLQRRVDAAARPLRRRRPDRRSFARHRRPCPPGRRIRPPARRASRAGWCRRTLQAPTASRPSSARSTNSAGWSSNWPSRWRSHEDLLCLGRGRPRPAPVGQAAFPNRQEQPAIAPGASGCPPSGPRPLQPQSRHLQPLPRKPRRPRAASRSCLPR